MKLRALMTIVVLFAILPGPVHAQVAVPLEGPGPLERALDYSYCRFDSLTIALAELWVPAPIHAVLANEEMHPRFLPIYITALDGNLDDPDGPQKHKFIYSSDGMELGVVVLLEKFPDGTWNKIWQTQEVPPAGHVRLRLRDLNRDGRPDLVATARGGMPSLEAFSAFSFVDSTSSLLFPRVREIKNPGSMIGIGVAINDTLGRNGYPAIEVWKDDERPSTGLFVRIVHQFADSTGKFLPDAIDTLNVLPRWCRGRRAAGSGE